MGARIPMRWESTSQQWWFATPVDWAAANGYFEVVRELLRLDGNLLMKLSSLRRIRRFEAVWEEDVHFTNAAKGRGRVARELLGECETRNGNILIEAGYGGWLLYTAAAAGDGELVRYLLKREPSLVLGQGEFGISEMLYAAAWSGDSGIFKDILVLANDMKFFMHNQNKDASMYAPSLSFQMMNRALHAASRAGCLQMLRELLRHCVNVALYRDKHGSSVLHSAASLGKLEVVKELLSITPDIIASTDEQRNTPLHVAAYRGHSAIVKHLLQHLPSLAMSTNVDGNTALHLAVSGFRASGFKRLDKQMDVVKSFVDTNEILDLPRLINCKNKEGRTAMHMAVLGKVIHASLVDLLMNVQGLDINASDKNGMTAVDILELNLISGITSEALLKQMVAVGGKALREAGNSASINAQSAKIWRSEVSPGTSFRSMDSENANSPQLPNNHDKAKVVEGILEASSSRLSAYAMFDLHDKNNYCLGGGNHSRLFSLAQHARRRLATLLGWSSSHEKTPILRRHSRHSELEIIEKRPKTITQVSEGATSKPAKDSSTLHSGIFGSELSLRQKYAKPSSNSMSMSHSQRRDPNIVGRFSLSPRKHKLPKLCGNETDSALSPAMSSFASPSMSFSHSPMQSPTSINSRVKKAIESNGHVSSSSHIDPSRSAEDYIFYMS